MCTTGGRGEIDRRTAVRTIHDLDVLSEFGDLLRGQRSDEILLAQKLHETNQPAMTRTITAPEVTEPRVPLHILSRK